MKKIIVGSRESMLAVAQSDTVVNYLRSSMPDTEIILSTMKTTGDKILDRTLDQVGGKGLFVKELDLALKDGRADITVHSLKDVPMDTDPELPLVAFSKREDPRDVLVLPKGERAPNPALPIGSSSLRRVLQLEQIFHGYAIEPVRGNLQTRLKKLDSGQYGALVLAAAGLKRLGLEHRISRYFSVDQIIPAAGQAIIAVQGRKGEDHSYLDGYCDKDSKTAALCERAYVRALNGGCTSPVCAHAEVSEGTIRLRALYYDEETGQHCTAMLNGPDDQPEELGIRMAEVIINQMRYYL